MATPCKSTHTVPDPVGPDVPDPRLVPTFGPETTKSGAVPSKNGGPVVWMPDLTAVTLDYEEKVLGNTTPITEEINSRERVDIVEAC